MRPAMTALDWEWQSHRGTPDIGNLPATKQAFIEPMRAKRVDALPAGERWRYEVKLDGYRTLALRGEEGVRLLSRNNKSLNERFRSVVAACEGFPPGTIADGEVVALDDQGRPSFTHAAELGALKHPLVY